MNGACIVVAVANPASVDPLVRMGGALARAKNGRLTITSVSELPDQLPVTADNSLASQQEAIIKRAVSVADSLGVPAEGRVPPSHNPAHSIVSLVENTGAAGLLIGSDDTVPFEESLLGRTVPERIIDEVTCEVYVEHIGPAPAVPGDSILVPVADGAHTDTVVAVATAIARAYDMDIHLVTVVSPDADIHTVEQTEQRLRTQLPDKIGPRGAVTAIPGKRVVETLADLTGDHDVTVLGATEESIFRQFMSGTVPAGLVKRSQNTLLLVANSS